MKHLLKSLINIIKTKTYDEDLINSINFDIIDNKEIYNKLIYIYSIFEKYIEAINLFNKYKHIFIQDEGTLFCMIKIYYLVDNITEAENIFKNFKFNVNIRHYYYILKYYSENDKKKLIDIYNHTYKNLKLKLREEEIELFVKPELKSALALTLPIDSISSSGRSSLRTPLFTRICSSVIILVDSGETNSDNSPIA